MTIIFSNLPRRRRKSFNTYNLAIKVNGADLKDGRDFIVSKTGNIIIYKSPKAQATFQTVDGLTMPY